MARRGEVFVELLLEGFARLAKAKDGQEEKEKQDCCDSVDGDACSDDRGEER